MKIDQTKELIDNFIMYKRKHFKRRLKVANNRYSRRSIEELIRNRDREIFNILNDFIVYGKYKKMIQTEGLWNIKEKSFWQKILRLLKLTKR